MSGRPAPATYVFSICRTSSQCTSGCPAPEHASSSDSPVRICAARSRVALRTSRGRAVPSSSTRRGVQQRLRRRSESQLPTRTPCDGTSLIRAMRDANSGASSLLSAASTARFRTAVSLQLPAATGKAIPFPASTQWELVKRGAGLLWPVLQGVDPSCGGGQRDAQRRHRHADSEAGARPERRSHENVYQRHRIYLARGRTGGAHSNV